MEKVTRGLSNGRQWANARAPSIEEILRLCEYSNRDVRNCGISLVISPLIRQESANE
ncbi:MAG: hypothetical protein M3299_01830 [Thermoproteota archaeon]|nr:hypothetical protein [Thermoproteota archaeon]